MGKEPSMFNVLYTIGPTKSGAHGVAAIKKAFKVDDKKAKELLDKAIDFSSNGKIKTLPKSQQSMLNKQSDSMKEEVISELTITPFKKGQKVKVFLAKSRDRELKDLASKFGDTIVGTVTGQSGNYYMVKTPKGQLNPHKDDILGEEVALDEGSKEKALKALMTKALGGKRAKPGYTSSIASNGDFVVHGGMGNVVGRLKKGEFKNPLGEGKEMKDLDTKNVDKALAHDCAKHVVHEKWGEGKCIPEMHSLEEREDGTGFVTHYDVMFEHGVEQNVPVEDLEIVVSESHMHSKKKMKEEFDNGDEVEGGNEEPQMDPVNKKALKKKFKDRKDKDIDNDGDVDDSDKYLHMRRKAVSKALDKKNN